MLDDIEQLLELYSLEEVFEVLDITPTEVIEILLHGGHCVLPPFLSTSEDDERLSDEG